MAHGTKSPCAASHKGNGGIMIRCPLAILFAACLGAQSGPPVFDVISIKPHRVADQRRGLPQFLPGGRFVSTGIPVQFVISVAYNVGFQSVRLTGGPDWLRSPDSVYDIEATPSPDALPAGLPSNVRGEKLRAMLQSLLQDRFHLQIRRETREVPVYAVVPAKGGPKLQKSAIP